MKPSFFRLALAWCGVCVFLTAVRPAAAGAGPVKVAALSTVLADALSHSLLPGLAVGAIFFGLAPLGLFVGAVLAALLVGVGGQLVARSSRLKDETAIGALYTVKCFRWGSSC